jgi:hypothetical protein
MQHGRREESQNESYQHPFHDSFSLEQSNRVVRVVTMSEMQERSARLL